MSHPSKISHFSTQYSLKHLWQRDDAFDWRTAKGAPVSFIVATTFSDHCYTDAKLPFMDGCYWIGDEASRRVFCPDRHARSVQLPALVYTLMSKPTKTVSLTQKRNWMSFELGMTPPLANGERYYLFFNVKAAGSTSNGRHLVRLHVESAYAKKTRIDVKRNAPFGRIVEEAIFGA